MCYTVPLYEPVTEFILDIETDKIMFTMPELVIDGFNNNNNTFKEFNINEIFPLGFVSLGYLLFWNIPLAKTPMVNFVHFNDVPFKELDNKRRSKFYNEQTIETRISNNFDGFKHIESFLAAVVPNMDNEKYVCGVRNVQEFKSGNKLTPIISKRLFQENITSMSTPRKKAVTFTDKINEIVSLKDLGRENSAREDLSSIFGESESYTLARTDLDKLILEEI